MAEDLTEYYGELGGRFATCTAITDTPTASRSCATYAAASSMSSASTLGQRGPLIPEVSLVAILEADKRAASSVCHARSFRPSVVRRETRRSRDHVRRQITAAMKVAMEETSRRREIQAAYNEDIAASRPRP
ncbi:MAG: hypothetical protein R3B99_05430 [Polyangiales bacterium]